MDVRNVNNGKSIGKNWIIGAMGVVILLLLCVIITQYLTVEIKQADAVEILARRIISIEETQTAIQADIVTIKAEIVDIKSEIVEIKAELKQY